MFKIKYLLLVAFVFFVQDVFSQKSAGQPSKIYVFYSNDLRGGIEEQKAYYLNPLFPPQLGGGASTATLLKKYRKLAGQEDITLLLDAGNIFSGTPAIGRNSKGLAIIEYMNKMGYDAMAPGVHDFDFGYPNFLRLSKAARFPVLAANVTDSITGQIPAPLLPYTVLERNEYKIGVFGITSKATEQMDDPTLVRGVVFRDEVTVARKTVQELKKRKVDFIIALTNLGLPYDTQKAYETLQEMDREQVQKLSYVNTMEFAHFVPGIDVIISGGINKGYRQPWEDPVNHTICVQDYAHGGNLGLLILNVDRETHSIVDYSLPSPDGGLLLLSEDEFWPDEEMAHQITNLKQKYAPDFDQVIGVTYNTISRSSRGESEMGDLMCDAILEETGVDFVFNNYSGMRQDIQIGPITPRKISTVFPFGNEIVLIKIKGKLLKKLMEASVYGSFAGLAIAGGHVTYDNQKPDGQKIIHFSIKGQPLDAEKIYRVATSQYLAEGNAGMTPLAFLPDEDFTWTKKTIREAVETYVKKHSPLRIEKDGRWVRK